jgi:hypothetical protein
MSRWQGVELLRGGNGTGTHNHNHVGWHGGVVEEKVEVVHGVGRSNYQDLMKNKC